jgi:hypothetical protein
MSAELAKIIQTHILSQGGVGRTIIKFLLLPINLTLHEWKYMGPFSAVFLIFLPFLVFVRRTVDIRFFLLFSLGYTILWFCLLPHNIRFLTPLLPALCGCVGYVAPALAVRTKKVIGATAIGAMLLVHVLYGLGTSVIGESGLLNEKNFLLGTETRKEYLERNLSYYTLFRWIDKHTPSNAKILLGGDLNQGYYLNREYMWFFPNLEGFFDMSKLHSVKALQLKLDKSGITHIAFYAHFWKSIERNNFPSTLTAEECTIWKNYAREHLNLIYTDNRDLILFVKKY